MSDRPKLGTTFAPPDRTAGLGGLLTNRPPVDVNEGGDVIPLPAATVEPRIPVRTPRRAPAPTTTPKGDVEPDTRVVSVQIDVAVLERLRATAARTTLTHGAIALRAVDEHATALSEHWAQTAPSGGLFPDTPGRRHRAQATTQTQLRISPAAAAVLDDLTRQWRAPSRSALVNEALRRYLNNAEQTP